MQDYEFTVVVELDEDGRYIAIVPVLQGCYSEGDTYEEAMENVRDAIRLHVQARRELGERIPTQAGANVVKVSA